MFCTNCGASNKEEARFCVNCAESLGEIQIEVKLSRPILKKDASIFKKVLLLRALFDFSFNQFVSPKILKFLYGLTMFSGILIALFFAIAGFKASIVLGIFALFIGAPRISDQLAEIDTASVEENPESRESIQWNI